VRIRDMWAGVAAGAVLAVAAGFAVDGAMDRADAQAEFSVTSAQLKINQRISQAALRRSNANSSAIAAIRSGAAPVGGGEPGPQGPRGPQGPAGPTGAAGAVAATDAYTPGAYLGEPIPSAGNNEVVMSTADNSGGKFGPGPLVFTERKRIVANGAVDVRNTGATNSAAICFFGAQAGGSTSSFRMSQDPVTVPAGHSVRVALSGANDVDAGSYNVVILCRGGATVRIEKMSLNAVVADR
jgi:hypothetical protein